MFAKDFYRNGKRYMTEYYTNNILQRLDIYSNDNVKFSTFFSNGNIREVFNGEGIVYYNPDGSIKKKLYYVNGEISTVEEYDKNKIVNVLYNELKNRFFPLYLSINL
jgi:antitoxin component YwqK of YwqJK toxin-antitoxin module